MGQKNCAVKLGPGRRLFHPGYRLGSLTQWGRYPASKRHGHIYARFLRMRAAINANPEPNSNSVVGSGTGAGVSSGRVGRVGRVNSIPPRSSPSTESAENTSTINKIGFIYTFVNTALRKQVIIFHLLEVILTQCCNDRKGFRACTFHKWAGAYNIYGYGPHAGGRGQYQSGGHKRRNGAFAF
jgi:hypothetical protein